LGVGDTHKSGSAATLYFDRPDTYPTNETAKVEAVMQVFIDNIGA
jgi:hypothetical protein